LNILRVALYDPLYISSLVTFMELKSIRILECKEVTDKPTSTCIISLANALEMKEFVGPND
jgi:hypothetical protein